MSYITAETSIAEIVYAYPELVEPLHQIGLYCFSWGGRPAWGTLALQARFRGIDDVNQLVDGLNKIIAKNREKQSNQKSGTDDEI